jgi:hypothetical protein
MAWVHIQSAQEASWEDYEKVSKLAEADENPPEGLIVHAAGEENGRWRSVSVWESQAAYEKFREERLLPAVERALGEEAIKAGPPPAESFDAKHLVQPAGLRR